jgi:hypothetical protein
MVGRAVIMTVAVLTAVALSPVFLVVIPAMADFVNHLARMYILVTDGTADANPYYQVHWTLFPDLAMDIIVPPMARLISVLTATKIFLITSQLLVVTGAMAIEFVVKHRHEFAGFVALLMLYSAPFTLGLLNFEFGMGVALWGIASWIAFKDYRLFVRLIVHSLFVACLFIAHFFALGVYGATIGLLELPRFRHVLTDFKNSIRLFAIMAGPVFLFIALMILTGGALGSGIAASKWYVSSKLQAICFFFNIYNPALSAVIMGSLIALIYCFFRERYLSISTKGKRIAAGFLCLFILMPYVLFGSAMADVRIITAAVLILPAFIVFKPSKRISWPLASSIAGLAITANTAYTAFAWQSYQNDYREIKASFGLIEPYSLVLIGMTDDAGFLNSDYHPMASAPTLAVYYAKALVPHLFTLHGAQPVELRPDYESLAIDELRHYEIPVWGLQATTVEPSPSGTPTFLRNWPQRFDYLYILGPRTSNPLPHLLTEITAGRRFTLYHVRK